jgi:S1/P1 Nuclease
LVSVGEGKFPECKVYENPSSEAMMERFVRRNVDNCTSPHNDEVCHKQYHYTDVAIQRDAYKKGLVGTSDQDIVAAVSAAISVLQGNDSPEPFKFGSKKEALRLLVHYVGDIHQPLHVAAVYLDTNGKVTDPDVGVFDPNTETQGGNDLFIGMKKLHGEWDFVGGPFTSEPPTAEVLKAARAIPVTAGPISSWVDRMGYRDANSRQRSIQGHQVFEGGHAPPLPDLAAGRLHHTQDSDSARPGCEGWGAAGADLDRGLAELERKGGFTRRSQKTSMESMAGSESSVCGRPKDLQ